MEAMNCPGTEGLLGYLFKELSAAASAEIQAHLDACSGCREELKTMQGLDLLLGEFKRADQISPVPGSKCLDTATLSAYLDKNLSSAERSAVERHLVGCRACLDELVASAERLEAVEENFQQVPQDLVERAIGLGPRKPQWASFEEMRDFFDLVVRFVKDSIELVQTSGQLILSPAPVAVRGETKPSEASILRVKDSMGENDVVVEMERTKPGLCQLVIKVEKKESGPVDAARVTLILADREVASYRTRDGQAVFEDVAKGEYSIVVSEAGTKLGSIRLRVEGEP